MIIQLKIYRGSNSSNSQCLTGILKFVCSFKWSGVFTVHFIAFQFFFENLEVWLLGRKTDDICNFVWKLCKNSFLFNCSGKSCLNGNIKKCFFKIKCSLEQGFVPLLYNEIWLIINRPWIFHNFARRVSW